MIYLRAFKQWIEKNTSTSDFLHLSRWARLCRALFGAAALLLVLLAAPAAVAVNVTLAWDPSPDPVAGYAVYAVELGSTNITKVVVGNQTTAVLNGLNAGESYLIYVTAVGDLSIESTPGESLVYSPGQTGQDPTPDMPPVILTQPVADTTLNEGATLELSLDVSSTVPVSYQWIHNGAPIAGATSQGLTIPAVVVQDAGRYAVFVNYSGGSILSSPANVVVFPSAPAQPLVLDTSSVLTTVQDQPTAPATVTLRTPDADPASVSFSVESLNPELVSADAVMFGGAGANRYLVVVPVPNQSGTAQIVLTARLGDLEVRHPIRVQVMPNVPVPPKIIGAPEFVRLAAGQRLTLPLLANDLNGTPATLKVSSDPPGLPVSVSGDSNTLTLGVTIAPQLTQQGTFTLQLAAQSVSGLESLQATTVLVIPPILKIESSNSSCTVSWPNLSGVRLQIASDLSGAWQHFTGPGIVVGSEQRATFSVQDTPQFFRLTVE